jgi:hypothetical protein
LEELFKGKPYLVVMLKERRWVRVRARIKNMDRLYGSNGRRERKRKD